MATWYIAPWGTSKGDGTLYNPYDLDTALGVGSPVVAGDVVRFWRGEYVPLESPLAGGTGTADTPGKGVKNLRISGTSGNLITLKPIEGHWVRINGGLCILDSYSAYIRVEGMEIAPTPDRRDWTGATGSIDFPACIRVTGRGCEIIGNLLHDGAEALTVFGTIECKIECNIMWNNGWEATANPGDYNCYTHNNTTAGNGVEFYRNIFAPPYGYYNLHIFSASNYLLGYTISQNIFLGKPNRYLPPSAASMDITINSNELYGSYQYAGSNSTDYDGNFSVDGDYNFANFEWTNSHYVMYINRLKDLYVANCVFGATGANVCRLPYYSQASSPDSESWDNNTYYQSTGLTLDFLVGITPATYSFTNWKIQTPFDGSSSYTASDPTSNRVVVRANASADSESRVVGIASIWNWEGLDSVDVDVSGIGLTLGQTYLLRNAMNMSETAYFVYDGTNVSVPMANGTWSASVPSGDTAVIMSHPGGVFGAFSIEKSFGALADDEPAGNTGIYVGVYNSTTEVIDWFNRNLYGSATDLIISDSIGSEGDTMSCTMRFPASFAGDGGDRFELPLSGQIVKVVIDDIKLFEGIIPATSNEWLMNGTVIYVPLSASSYALLLNSRHAVKQNMSEGAAGRRIKALLEEFGDVFGGDLSYIENGPTIPEESYDYQSLGSVIGKIASMVGYMWYVDFDKRVHFYVDLEEDAPITAIDADTDLEVGDLVLDSDASAIANVIIIKDFVSRNANRLQHTTTSDGLTSFYSLPMPPWSVADTQVYVRPEGGSSWIERIVVDDPLNGSDESTLGEPGLAYLCTFNWGVRFPTVDMPGAGDDVRVDYNPEVPERIIVVFDEDSIAEFSRREGTDGHHELVVSASDFRVANDEPIQRLGQMLLKRRAWPVVSGSFTIRTSNYGEWQPGQTFTITSDMRDIFDLKTWVASGYLTKDPVRVWVTTVKRRFEMHDTGIVEFDAVEFSSQPYDK